MSRFFVGQRVRLVKSRHPQNRGLTGVITHLGHWVEGDVLPSGLWLEKPMLGHCDAYVQFDRKRHNGMTTGPAHTSNLEPILPEGHKPCEESFLLDLNRVLEREGGGGMNPLPPANPQYVPMIDHETLERMAAQLCWMAGGDWNKKRTKKNLWRGRVLKLLEMVEARP